jgi:hypothetical protein
MAWFERTPPEVRRLTYKLTLFEELQAALRDPVQVGILLGAIVGAIGMALARAGNQYASHRPRPTSGLQLPAPDAETTRRAQQIAARAIRHVLDQQREV